jgi:5-dehydro-2-deoxygluconokinase
MICEMIPPARDFDVVHVGRACLDLYSNDIGAPFTDVTSFAAYVGGSPANVCVGARRLGLHVAMLAAIGDDPPGDFVVSFLQREGIDTGAIVRKPGFRTGLAMLSIEPPDHFSLIYYRDRPADWELDLDDLANAPIARTRVLQIAGTNLAREPSRSATAAAAEAAAAAGTSVVLDLDFRADQWEDPRRFGLAVRAILPLVDVVIGTEDEFKAIALQDRTAARVVNSEVSEAFIPGDLTSAIEMVGVLGPEVLVCKHGSRGSTVHRRSNGGKVSSSYFAGYSVPVCNTLGAGDAYAAGFIFGLLQGWGDERVARFANACGAIVVSRHGCSNSMPTHAEVEQLLADAADDATAAFGRDGVATAPAVPQNAE